MRVRFLLAYVGTHYHGWQRQKPGLATIQGILEETLETLCGTSVTVTGAGRTDAGVHALGQTAHADLPSTSRITDWRRSANALLPRDIRVLQAEQCPETFHARFDAREKTYLYRFWTEEGFLPPQYAPQVWDCGSLDLAAMQEALTYIVGQHDFSSFQNTGTDLKSTVRTVFSATLTPSPPHPFLPPHAPELVLRITADGFLKQMVRNIAGLLRCVGKKQIKPEAVRAILSLAVRTSNPSPTAPPSGLTLAAIRYA